MAVIAIYKGVENLEVIMRESEIPSRITKLAELF